MDFAFSAEQQMLRAAARDYLSDRYPFERVVEVADGKLGSDPAAWPQLVELGWVGLSVPEGHGGAGMSFLDEVVLFEEAGRALLPAPYFATVGLALPALAAAAPAGGGADTLLAGVLAGERTATLAWAEADGPVALVDVEAVSVTASRTPDGWALTGTKRFVPDLAAVSDVIVVARAEDGVGLWRVDLRAGTEGGADVGAAVSAAVGAEVGAAVVVPHSTMDRTRRLGDLVLAATPATLLVSPGQAKPVLEQVRLRALAALAGEAVGVAERCLEIAAEYTKTRQQFGRVIGTYQGVSHRIADIFVALQLARSLAYWAAWAVSVGAAEAPLACAAAKSAAGEAAVFAAENAIQAMGGIGFTWDHPLHRYYKRALGIDAFEGYGREHRADIAAALLDAPTVESTVLDTATGA
jgi:alkylation response protein AidB-like acyl-CoA dehydrogenase